MARQGWQRALERFASSKAGGWYFINVANKIDKHLVPATRGAVSTAIGQQVLVVEYHNLKANSEVRVWAKGRSGRYRAREAEGDERARLWDTAVEYYDGYAVYQRRTGGRRIPVMVLEPVSA